MSDSAAGDLAAVLETPAAFPAVAERPLAVKERRSKPVVVTGAAGLVGTHTCHLLAERGWSVRAIVRNTAKAAERLGHLKIEIRSGDIRNADSMRAAMKGAGAVVHLAAIAIESKGQDYESTNTQATQTVLDAAQAESVERIIYMSQNGADSQSPYPFLRSKGVAQDAVSQNSLDWTILRPSVIFGPEDEFVNVLARLVRLSPLVYALPGGGTARFQPVAVDDVARAILFSLENDSTIGKKLSLGGSTPLTLRQMVERILVAMGTSRTLVGLPVAIIRPAVALAGKLLPNPPVTPGLLDLLDLDNVIPENALVTEMGVTPIPFAPEELLYLRKINFSGALRSLFKS